MQEHPPVAEAVHDDRPYGWQRWVYSTDHKDILDLLVFLLAWPMPSRARCMPRPILEEPAPRLEWTLPSLPAFHSYEEPPRIN